ncbi:hypothetical protein ABZV14_26520, partial [Streptosporangium canum]|uniref:hypothetical protein n=1 Tax=Streptosporangium canum TaxID=324952 RepID=UPI0034948577
ALRLFVGDDWAEQHHDVELMDASGRRLAKARGLTDVPDNVPESRTTSPRRCPGRRAAMIAHVRDNRPLSRT